ncbi:MAG: hypothetical protein ABIP77_10100 [Candidatus Limnocylindrales bacterium]
MTKPRDPGVLLSAYLADGMEVLPDRVADAVLDEIHRTRQRAVLGSWRTRVAQRMNSTLKIALAAAAVIAVTLVGVTYLPRGGSGVGGLAVVPPGRPEGIFADVGGWIAFGDRGGIWAVDPTRPDEPERKVQLSSEGGTPKAWSPDGSKLLVLRDIGDSHQRTLFVLNADGTETRLGPAMFRSGGDFTPDGSRVVYAAPPGGGHGAGIYVIDADGGTPELLLAAGSRWVLDGGCPQYEGCVDGKRLLDTSVYEAALSPDGTQIAYFDGIGDWGHSLRVMNSDGTVVRVVVDNDMTSGAGHVDGLDWSPDGRHLLFAIDLQGVYVVGIDGAELMKVSSGTSDGLSGQDPRWSPDGSLISHNTQSHLVIARGDGTRVQELDYGRSGPWNPR